jgi:hypothetical protein
VASQSGSIGLPESSHRCIPNKRQHPLREPAQLPQPRAFLDLLHPQALHRLSQLRPVLDERLAVDAEEAGEESLDGLKVLV